MAVPCASQRFQVLLIQLKEEYELQLGLLSQQICSLREQCPEAEKQPGRDSFVTSNACGAGSVSEIVPKLQNAGKGDYAPLIHVDGSSTTHPPFDVPEHSDFNHGIRKPSDTLKLKDEWMELRLLNYDTRLDSQCMEARDLSSNNDDEIPPNRGIRSGFIHPNATWRLTWDVVGAFLVFFDLLSIPFEVFDPPVSLFSMATDVITLFFWTGDMIQSTCLGYFSCGKLVWSQPAIVLHYLKTWFVIDLLAVGPDLILMIPDWILLNFDSKHSGSSSRLLRIFRIVRVLRLLRIMKLQRVINVLYDKIDNEYSFIVAEMVKLMLGILILNHVIACGWFLVGKWSVDFEMQTWTTWTENFMEADLDYQYTTSLHWTLTQFTPASMDVTPRNVLERCYSIVVLLFAMVAFSSIVGAVTSCMTMIRQMRNNKQKQFWMLRRYLKQKNIEKDLKQRMVRFLEHRYNKQQNTIQASAVPMLGMLSDQLSREMSYEMHSTCLETHVFFKYLSETMKSTAYTLCHHFIPQQVAAGDVVFNAGEEACRLFVMKSGQLDYIMPGEKGYLDPPPRNGEWLAEAVLWTPWRYRGKCCVGRPSELLTLVAGRFSEVLSIHPKPWEFARQYGEKFVDFVNTMDPAERTDVLRNNDFYECAVHVCAKRSDDIDNPFEHGNQHANGQLSADTLEQTLEEATNSVASNARFREAGQRHLAQPIYKASGTTATSRKPPSRAIQTLTCACFSFQGCCIDHPHIKP